MSRSTQALPEPPADLTGFPGTDLTPDQPLYRAHSAGREPWWFTSAPPDPHDGGRFDVAHPRGTCYVATDPSTAVRERLADELLGVAVISRATAAAMEVSALRVATPARLADTSSRQAEGTITREITSTDDYALTQRWAAALDRDGFAGVRYESRFTTRTEATAIALFDEHGLRSWPVIGALDVLAVLSDMDIQVQTYRPSRHHRTAPGA